MLKHFPNSMLKKWRAIEQSGGTPCFQKRRYWGVEDEGPADPLPVMEATLEEPEFNGERKLRFRLIKFQDMRPGLEPAYLVDELMPSAGLVLVWGKQKTFKSFWLLDLFVHVAMGWPYRDHAVRQGPVIYCAFEGGHGYKGRIEAIRRHYGINDDVNVPLYVMPGQVDLIADEKALVDEFRYQLGTVVPAVVVLDTLNRSLSGSESNDKDMTLYVKAAEAVRKAFGCLCVIVHHCGYDDTHARGHTSLPAAVDAELSVMRDEGSPIVLVTVKAMRDGPEGMVVRSRALPVPLDPDQNGKPRSSIVIVPDDDETIVIPTSRAAGPIPPRRCWSRYCARQSTRRANISPPMARYPFRPSISSTCENCSTVGMSTPRRRQQIAERAEARLQAGVGKCHRQEDGERPEGRSCAAAALVCPG